MLKFIALFFVCVSCIAGYSQTHKALTDSIFSISEVTVSSKRTNQFSSGLTIRTIDSITMARYAMANLSQLLAGTGSGQVNVYGPGASSISSRGTTSSHTAILWNGLNLQDMFNGGCDLSQIQTGFIDEIKVQSGGNSALFGSGAIGGVIHLNSIPDYDKGFTYKLKSGIGDFNERYYGATLSYSNKKVYQVVKAYLHGADNNYPFRNNGSVETLNNSKRVQSGLMVGFGVKPKFKGEFDIFYWNQNNSQDIMSVTISNEHQSDNRNILNAGWKYSSGSSTISLRTGLNHHLLYYNYLNKYTTIQFVNEVLYTRRWRWGSIWNAGANVSADAGWFPGSIQARRNLYALFGSYKIQPFKSLDLYGNLRQGMANSTLFPLTFSFGFETRSFNIISFRGNLSRNYRIPTYNDLYYPGAGIPDLRSEDGLNTELTAVVNLPMKDHGQAKLEITGFSNHINDLILWQPIDAVRWNPFNIGKVWARGLENNTSFKWIYGKWAVQASCGYAYTLSTNENLDVKALETFRKQLIYIPRHKGFGSVLISYKQFGLSYNHQYSGLRYYEQDNSKFVKSYQVGNVSVFADLKYVKHSIGINFSIRNIWNRSYEIVRQYPMPPRNYQLGIQISLNQ